MVVLHALGQCLIRTTITTITPRANMCFALASYLTRERGNRVPRRLLETLLWPRMRAAGASHSLSELIHKLGRKGLHIARDDASCIWVPREAACLDIDLMGMDPPMILAQRDLSILPGYSPRVSPRFNDWLDECRGEMQLRVLDQVLAAISRSSAANDWSVALALTGQALKIDARNEVALTARAGAARELAQRNRIQSDSGKRSGCNAHAATPVAALLHEHAAPVIWHTSPSNTLAGDDTALVGRAPLMERLTAQATLALRGEVRAAFISGAAGVGKSRLVRELACWMRENGGAVCLVSCGRHDGHRPLSTFIQAVPRLQALPGAAGCEPATVSCLSRITMVTAEGPDITAREDTLNLSASVRESVIDLVDAVAHEQPLLLVIEDVHWIDPASWSLLRAIIAAEQHSILLVCTSRVRWHHSTLGEADNFAIEVVPALDASAARSHMSNYLAKLERSTDDRFLNWCVDMSGGNPYFVEELVNFWIATGEQYSAPPSLIALIEARLVCLRPEALRVIQAAAVLGKNSTIELLQRVLELPTHILLSSIEELGEAGLLKAAPASITDGSSASVLCRHDLVTRAATRGLSTHGRALLHYASAQSIESLAPGSRSAELLWDCADHWQAAGQSDRSISAAVECARHLHDMGLLDDAIKRCDTALMKCQNDSGRAIVLRAKAQSQYAAHDWKPFCGTVAEIRAIDGPSHTVGSIHDDLELCELNAQRSMHRDWNGTLDRLLMCVRSFAANPSHRVQAAINALKIATNTGDWKIMDAVYRDAAPLLQEPTVRTQDRLALVMIYESIRGDSHVGVVAARDLLVFAERTLPIRHRLMIMLDCVSAIRRGGVLGESEVLGEALFRSAIQFRCYDIAAQACNRLIEMHSDAGRLHTADEWVTEYRQLRRPKQELCSQRSLRIAIARVHVWRGQWHAANQLLVSSAHPPLWEDAVTQLRGAAIATKIRLEIGRGLHRREMAKWVTELSLLNQRFRISGAQDYECYSLYLGYRYVGKVTLAQQLLANYVQRERRDMTPVAPEIVAELAGLNLRL